MERLPIDGDRRLPQDARALDLLAIGTVVVRRGLDWMGSVVRCAASSAMKLWVEPVSRRAVRVTAPNVTRTCMVSQGCTPATACKEKTGAFSWSPSHAASSASVSVTPSM